MILDIIRKIDSLESFDSKTIMETFSYEERRVLFTQLEVLFNDQFFDYQDDNKLSRFVDRIVKDRIIVFTEEELNRLQLENYEIQDGDFLYSQMSDEKLLEIIIKNDNYKAQRASRYIKNDETIYKIVELYINDELGEEIKNNISSVISHAKSDEFKIKCIQLLSKLPRKKRIDDYEKSNILCSLSSDDAKITHLGMVSNEYKTSVITSMDSDDTKVRYINLFSRGKGDIISSLEDDELKEFYFKKYYRLISSWTRPKVIASFKDESIIRKYLPLIGGNQNIIEFIYMCDSDELRIEAARKLTSDKSKVEAIGQIKKEEYQLELIKSIRNFKVLTKDDNYLYYDLSLESKKYFMSYLNEDQKSQLVKSSRYPQNIILLTNIHDFKKALEILVHIEDYFFGPYTDEINPTIDYLAQNLNIDAEKLKRLTATAGTSILKYLNNKNITDCLHLSDADFEKYMMLIKTENQKMDMSSVNDVLNAILNRRFKIEKREDNEIFQSFQMAIETRDKAKLKVLLNKLSDLIDVKHYISDIDEFVERLVSRDIPSINQLHDLTQEYIRIAKDNYTREKLAETREQIVSIVVDRGEYVKILLASYETEELIKLIRKIKDKIPETNLQELIDNQELLEELIEYKKDPKKHGAPSKEIKRNLKDLNIVLNYLYKFKAHSINEFEFLKAAVTTAEEAPKPYADNVIFMLTEINVAELRDTVFTNEELFQELLQFIEKYKLLGWTDSVKELSSNSGLIAYDSTIAALISNYEAIVRTLREKEAKGEIPKATISHILDLAACYDSDSLIYKYIFSKDIFMLLKNNPGPNKSDIKAEERIAKGLELLKKMQERDSITTPPIDKDYNLSNGKALHVRLGHVNSLNNLTYGEQTGACMRIGGAGNSLFEFCLLNQNGFHIELSDPKTGEFVSRVSGFRNGNTVFLNQLRISKSPTYKNEDLIEVIKLVAKDIIELSKQSNYPIDNVVVSPDYAFEKSKEKITDLGVDNIKKGFDHFYTDVSGKAIILATSSEESEFVPVTLGTKNLPEYEPLRERMHTYKGEEAIIKINEMTALDEFLSDKPIEEIETRMDIDVKICYIGNDWFISISNDGQITTYIMESCKNKEKAEKEIKKVLNIIKEKSKQQIEMMSQQDDYSDSSSKHI